LNRLGWLALLGLVGAPFFACGPNAKPDELCDGPSFNLVVTAEGGALPADTRINVRYGGNQEGEPYALGENATPQAVFCVEDTTIGGAPAAGPDPASVTAGAGGAKADAGNAGNAVQALRCRLYTQGPARLDATATGYEPINDQALSLASKKRCEVEVSVKLQRQKMDAGT
jgi:hypothetical protein